MVFQIYDILYIVLTLIGLLVGKSAARFFGRRSSIAERDGLLAALDTLAEFAVSEVEQWAQGDNPNFRGEKKKSAAVKLLIAMLEEAVPASELKRLKVHDESKLLRAAVEHKVHEKHLQEVKDNAPGTTIRLVEN